MEFSSPPHQHQGDHQPPPTSSDALDDLTAGVQGRPPRLAVGRGALATGVQGQEAERLAASATGVQRLPAAPDVLAVAPCRPGALAAAPCAPGALAAGSCAQDVAVDGASPTDASAVALARSLMPTAPHPAIEYNLPVLDVQRY
jgi:hypothetical protein